MSVAALIVAAGRGVRASGAEDRPKQYATIGGVPMIAKTIAAFAAHPSVDDILVVINPDDEALYRAASEPYAGRLREAVAGGARRQDSVRAGLEALASAAPSSVLIHDAARPFVPAELIDRVIGGLDTHQGVLPALPVTDSLKRAAHGRVTARSTRESLWRAQTPQGFKFDAILAAHRAAAKEPGRNFTDDCGVAEWFGLDVALVEGAERQSQAHHGRGSPNRQRAGAESGASAAPARSVSPRATTFMPSGPAMPSRCAASAFRIQRDWSAIATPMSDCTR